MTDAKYKNYLFSIAFNIVRDPLDCEECLNDTYLGAWNAIPPARPNFLRAFLTTIVRRVAVNRYHRNTKKTNVPTVMTVSLSELEECIRCESTTETEVDARLLGRVISDFLYTLSRRRRYIFMSRYYIANTVDKIAKDLRISRSTVNKELAFIRSQLKETLEKEGYLV